MTTITLISPHSDVDTNMLTCKLQWKTGKWQSQRCRKQNGFK